MQPIIYDVAVSLDGYIAGPGGDITRFAHQGPVVDDYFARMAGYAAAIMGRNTYEFGYRFGLKPGDNPYEHMRTIVCSTSLQLPEGSAVAIEKSLDRDKVQMLKQTAAGPIYLCGGGAFAGELLLQGEIDFLRLKRAPVLLGAGTHLFNGVSRPPELVALETQTYDNGYLFQEFEVKR